MIPYLGDFPEDATVLIPFNTFSSDDPAASVTITNLADADIKVHKNGSTTEIVTDGATVAIDFDSVTGNHLVTIDTSVHADYSTGADYLVRMEGTTVDGATVNAWIGSFSIENRYMRGTDSANTTTPPTAAAIRAEIDSNSTQLAAIVADTNELQSDDIPGTLATIASYIDTEVAAIKSVTDNLPNSGALTDLATAAALATVDSNVDAILEDTATTLPAAISAVETDTQDIQSRLPASLSNGAIDANITRVNDTAVTGDGSEGTEWGPA